jgi:hypothetical protein
MTFVEINGVKYKTRKGLNGDQILDLSANYQLILIEDDTGTFYTEDLKIDTDGHVIKIRTPFGYQVVGAMYSAFLGEKVEEKSILIIRKIPEMTLDDILMKSTTFQLFYQQAMMER